MGKSGFIRDPSGLLMSVIRTLEDHSDERHRDVEREKLEEAYADVDQKLDSAVEKNFEEIAATIKRFGEIGSGISSCRFRMSEVKEKLVQCKQLLHCRQDELRVLWVDGVEHKKSMALLEQVEIIRTTPTQVDALMYEGEWLAAVEKISRALNWCNGELAEVGALHDLRAELKNKHQILYDKLINELQRLIYGQHSDDQSVNEENLAKMETLARALDLLGKTDGAMEEIVARIDSEISSIVNRETTQVSDAAFSANKGEEGETLLLELLEKIFLQFRAVAKMHQKLLNNVAKQHYSIQDVWFKIQDILKFLLVEYLEEEVTHRNFTLSTLGAEVGGAFGGGGANKNRKMKLFRFDASGHAISMNTYLREKRQESGQNNEAYFSAVPVCKTSARNITRIYRPLMNFIEEIEIAVGLKEEGRHIALYNYVVDHIQKTFINQIKNDLRMEIDNATKVTDPLKVIADSSQQKAMGAPVPILQSSLVVCKSVQELVDVLMQLDEYRETFYHMICTVLQEFYHSIHESLKQLVQDPAEENEIYSATLSSNGELKKMIQSSSCWRKAFGIKVKLDSNSSNQAMLGAEAEFISAYLLKVELSKENIVRDPSDIKALANLHESLEWLTVKLRKTFGLLSSSGLDGDVLMSLNEILSKFQNVSELCLLHLHMEQRVRCFLFLSPLLKGARFDVKNSVALETDIEVSKLETEFRQVEEVLSVSLQPQKYRFVFEGLGHQLGTLLMEGAVLMTRISQAGVKKICRNIFTLQQALTNITMNREPALDQARQYYELLYQRPEELVSSVEESGPRYSLKAYQNALSLSYRSSGELGGIASDQSKHRQLEVRLSDVCQTQTIAREKSVDDYDF